VPGISDTFATEVLEIVLASPVRLSITYQKRLSADPDAALYEAAQCLVHTSPPV
jgi:hypothetical protein